MKAGATARLAKLEAARSQLSERVRAWLGQRPPLSAEELAKDADNPHIDSASLSPALRRWLGLWLQRKCRSRPKDCGMGCLAFLTAL